jgi:hypothetical protein
MARPEGFEPPTPRSVVRSNPQQHVLAWNRSRVFQGVPAFHFMSVRLSTSHCGNIRGNNPGHESTSCRLAITSHISRDARNLRDRTRLQAKPLTLRYLICGIQNHYFFQQSTLPCFHDVSILTWIDSPKNETERLNRPHGNRVHYIREQKPPMPRRHSRPGNPEEIYRQPAC